VALVVGACRASRFGASVGISICVYLGCSMHLRVALPPSKTLPNPAPFSATRDADRLTRLATATSRVRSVTGVDGA